MPEEPKWVRLDQIKAAVSDLKIMKTGKREHVVGFGTPEYYPEGNSSEGYRVGVSISVTVDDTAEGYIFPEVSEKDEGTLYPTQEAFKVLAHSPRIRIGKGWLEIKALEAVEAREWVVDTKEERGDKLNPPTY